MTRHTIGDAGPETADAFQPQPAAAATARAEPRQIGPYRILDRIGEGGMGVVYKAEQRSPVRRIVALKVIKLGMDTREVVARFEAERQALAMLSHPNVARVFEAGMTDDGRPFFAMEYVAGLPLTQYCEAHDLTTRQRLELFIPVCQAVQHAHQKGIIHRDLKPSNLLVTLVDGQPIPKVIDFGIAKAINQALTPHTLFTQTGSMIGTPEYMSPEQAMTGGLDVDTRTDIYSLGVILYELLTGTLPLDGKTLREAGLEGMVRMIRSTEPQRPSTRLVTLATRSTDPAQPGARRFRTLQRELRGDLDWIVLKCMEKDRSRRYETANGLAMDLHRHLVHEPVLARPPSAVYRMRKFAAKHSAGVAAALCVVVALLLGLALATYGFVRAEIDRDIADRARVDAQNQKTIAETERRLAEERRVDAQASALQAKREAENTRRALARANIALAEAAYREQDGAAVKAALDQVPADLRDTNWDYLLEHADTSRATIQGFHVGAAPHPARPGVFAVATANTELALVDARTADVLSRFPVSAMQAVTTYRRGLAISPDGKRLAAGSLAEGGIAIYDLDSGKPLVEWTAPETDTLEFSPDGRHLLQASTINGQVCLWDAATGRRIWSIPNAYRAVFLPAGDRIIAARAPARGLELIEINASDGTPIRQLPAPRAFFLALKVRPDGNAVITGDVEGFVRSIDLQTGQVLFETRVSSQPIYYLAITGDSRRIVTIVENAGAQSIRVLDAARGIYLRSLLGGSGKPEGLWVHPQSDDVLVTGPLTKTWNIENKPPRIALAPYGSAGLVDADHCLAGGPGTGAFLFDLRATPPAPGWSSGGAFHEVEISADGRIAAVSESGNIHSRISLLDVQSDPPREMRLLKVTSAQSFMRLSPDGGGLLSFIPEGQTCHAYETRSGRRLPENDPTGLYTFNDAIWIGNDRAVGAVITAAARGAAGSGEGLILWSPITGQQIRLARSHTVVNCLAAAPDARQFAEAGADRMIRLRDASTLDVQRTFRAHDDQVTALAWNPTRPLLASASADLTIKLWDLRTGRCLREIRGTPKPARQLRFSPDGTTLLAVTGGIVRIWAIE